MHLFRWIRFLSWRKRRSSSSPRRSSRWLLRHFSRSGASRSSLTGMTPSSSSISVSASYDLRPNTIYIDADSNSSRCSSETRKGERPPLSSSSLRVDDDDRQFIEDFHRQHGPPEALLSPNSRASAKALARVSSVFHPARRSTIMERASIVNLFNQLQFELPPMEPPVPDDPDPAATPPSATKKSRSRKNQGKRKTHKRDHVAAGALPAEAEFLPVDTSKERSLFRHCLMRTKSKLSNADNISDEPKFRPLSATQCHAYLKEYSVSLDGLSGRPSTNGSRCDDPPEPMQFLFFGGSSEEAAPHAIHELDGERRRLRAQYVADQPVQGGAASIPIKPSLVRGLPPVFEPTFVSVYL